MFKRNDYALLAARILLICSFIGGILLCPIISIWLAIKIHWTYFFIIFPMLGAVCVFWIIGRLVLSFLCDIKLIRNKMYENNNIELEVFIKSHKECQKSVAQNENIDKNNRVLNVSENNFLDANDYLAINEAYDTPNLDTSDSVKVNKDENIVSKMSENKVTKAEIISIILACIVVLMSVAVIILIRFYN